MDNITIALVETEAELEAAIAVRFRVFVDEQQIPAEIEIDADDARCLHALARDGGQAVGTGRLLLYDDGLARIGRMAVDREWRRNGVGGRILQRLEEAARAQGATEFVLHAQEYVKAFYAAHGYTEHGLPFTEAGLPHIEMRKPA